MSLGILIRGPEGFVFAAESRVTLDWRSPDGPADSKARVNFDTGKKLLTFKHPHNFIGVVTFGLGAIGNRTAYSFIPEIEAVLPSGRLSVNDFAVKFYEFFRQQWCKIYPVSWEEEPENLSQMKFIVGGYDDERAPYGRAYEVWIPGTPEFDEKEQKWIASKPTYEEMKAFGINYGGQGAYVDRIIKGYDYDLLQELCKGLSLNEEQKGKLKEIKQPFEMSIPYEAMALQDYVDLAILLVRTTIEAQRLAAGSRECGGPIDVATLNQREGIKYLQQKAL